MICVECDELVPSLYTTYQNGHIKLTDCQNCQQSADKYIEYDNVLLFIDIILLKPQAYKHLVYNLITDSGDLSSMIRKVHRIRFLSVLFEIYLNWAYKEKEVHNLSFRNPFLVYHAILTQNIFVQYLFFGLKCITDDILTHFLIHRFYLNWIKWIPKSYQTKKSLSKQDIKRLEIVLSITILISGGMKLFPIIMLIWPYDNVTITTIIASISNINLIESLRIVSNEPFIVSLGVFLLTTISRSLITKSILISILSKFNLNIIKIFAENEYIRLIDQIDSIKSCFL